MSVDASGYNGIQFAGEYNLKRLDLHSSDDKIIDLTGITVEINIFENIFLNAISASLIVVDTADIVNNVGIFGQEFVEMEIETPSLDEEAIVLTFSLYTVGAREDVNAGGSIYELSLVSILILCCYLF